MNSRRIARQLMKLAKQLEGGRRVARNDALEGYLEAILFTEEERFEKEGVDDPEFSKEALRKAEKDVKDFLNEVGDLLYEEDVDEKQFGVDFWLTRNGHGAGFWDGNYEAGGDLTDIAKSFGESYAGIDDDGLIDLT